MERVLEGKIINWKRNSQTGCFDALCSGSNWVVIEITSGTELWGLDKVVVEIRVKEPEPHICGEFRIERIPQGWVAESNDLLRQFAPIMVKHCPECGKKLE